MSHCTFLKSIFSYILIKNKLVPGLRFVVAAINTHHSLTDTGDSFRETVSDNDGFDVDCITTRHTVLQQKG